MRFVNANLVEASTNEVVDHFADSGANLKVEILDGSEVLIEGDANSLEFVANYILAYVNRDEHSRNIHPQGPASDLFQPGSTHGLYIHITPCRHGHDD